MIIARQAWATVKQFAGAVGLSLFMSLLGGCASTANGPVATDDVYVGWHCAGDINSRDDWNCQKRRLRNGIPVDDEVIEGPTPESIESQMERAITVDMDTESLTVAQREEAPSAPSRQDLFEPAPEQTSMPAPALASETVLTETQSPAPRSSRPSPPVAAPAPEPPASSDAPSIGNRSGFDLNATGYTLQFGAYSRPEKAYQAAQQLQLQEENVAVIAITSNGRPLHVLVYGLYNSSSQAQREGRQIGQGAEYWARSVQSLRNAAR